MQLDTLDLRILGELQSDGSLPNVELARRIGLSPSPCLARVKALQQSGVIRQYVALLDAQHTRDAAGKVNYSALLGDHTSPGPDPGADNGADQQDEETS